MHKALIEEMESLHSITDIRRLDRVHAFYNKPSRVVRTLSTMDKLLSAQSAVYTLMDKLGPVREVITQTDDKWEEWTLEQLVEALRKFVDRNPRRTEEKSKQQSGPGDGRRNTEKLMMQGSQRYTNANRCVLPRFYKPFICELYKGVDCRCPKRPHTKEEFVLQLYW